MLNKINLNKFHVFRTVAKLESIRRAAEELCLSPSAVSQSVSSLERQLETPLFERHGKRIALNDTGQKVLEKYANLEDGFAQGLHEILTERNNVEGIVKIGGYLEFTKRELQQRLSEFLKLHPRIQLKFFFNSPTGLERLLEERRIDMAFSIFPHQKSEIYHSASIFSEELVLLASSQISGSLNSLESISKHPIVDYYQSHIVIHRWLNFNFGQIFSNKISKDLNIRAYAGTAEMVLTFIEQNVGIGVVPRYVAETALARGTVKQISPTGKRLKDKIWLIEPRTNHNSFSHNSALDYFRAHILESGILQ